MGFSWETTAERTMIWVMLIKQAVTTNITILECVYKLRNEKERMSGIFWFKLGGLYIYRALTIWKIADLW